MLSMLLLELKIIAARFDILHIEYFLGQMYLNNLILYDVVKLKRGHRLLMLFPRTFFFK